MGWEKKGHVSGSRLQYWTRFLVVLLFVYCTFELHLMREIAEARKTKSCCRISQLFSHVSWIVPSLAPAMAADAEGVDSFTCFLYTPSHRTVSGY